MIRNVACEHDSSTEFAHSASKAKDDAGEDTGLSIRDKDMPEDIPIGNAEGLCGVDDIRVDKFKGTAGGAIHKREANDDCGNHGGFPREDERNIELEEELT